MINKIKGQDKIIASLIRAIESDKVGQSYLFYGPSGVGKLTTAFYFIMAINCTNREEGTPCGKCNSCRKFMTLSHPDLIYLFPTPNLKMTEDGEIKETKYQKEYEAYLQNKIENPWKDYVFSASSEIRIGAIRWVQNRLSLSKNEASKRICIIEDADRMNINTANAFLKTLEEPPPDTVIILTTSKPNSLLPTILSRCQRVAFNNLTNSTVEQILQENFTLDLVRSKTYARISYGNAEKAIQLISEDIDSGRHVALKLVKYALDNLDLEFLGYLTQLKEVKQKKQLQNIYSNIILFLMDIIYRRENPNLVINVDSQDLLSKIEDRKFITSLEIYSFIDDSKELQRMIELNVNNNLILTFLYNHLKKILKK